MKGATVATALSRSPRVVAEQILWLRREIETTDAALGEAHHSERAHPRTLSRASWRDRATAGMDNQQRDELTSLALLRFWPR